MNYITKSYKFRIYPNESQRILIKKTFGCCRFVYNHYLAKSIEDYQRTGKMNSRFQNDKDYTQLKKKEEFFWLKETDASAHQQMLKNLDASYQNFFRRVKQGQKPGFPKFKNKTSAQSYTTPNFNSTDISRIMRDNHMLYKITQIPIKLLIFYTKYGYFASCFLEVCEAGSKISKSYMKFK